MSRRMGKEKEGNEEEAIQTTNTNVLSKKSDLSLSIAETNNLRKKLGLAPLKMDSIPRKTTKTTMRTA